MTSNPRAELCVLQHITNSNNPQLLVGVNPEWIVDPVFHAILMVWLEKPMTIQYLHFNEYVSSKGLSNMFPQEKVDIAYRKPAEKFEDAVKIIEEKYLQRYIFSAIKDIEKIVYTVPPEEAVYMLQEKLYGAVTSNNEIQKLGDDMSLTNELLLNFSDRRQLNRLLVCKKTLMVIGGDSGMHKSNQCLDILDEDIECNPTHIAMMFSAEMDFNQVEDRIFARKFKISLEDVVRRTFDVRKKKDEFKEKYSYLRDRFLVVKPEQFSGIADVTKFLLKYKPDVWALDFLQFFAQMAAGNKADEQNAQVMVMIAAAKRIVQIYGNVGIIVSQVKKKREDRISHFPRLDDLEWSGLTKQLAEYIGMCFWPVKIRADEAQSDIYIVSWQKVRKNNTFNEFLKVEPEHCYFESITNPQHHVKYLKW